VIVSDVAGDPRWGAFGWGELTLDCGLRSCWTTPIFSSAGEVLGTFAIYQREPGSPTSLQQSLIEQLTYIASIAIERAQSEAVLRRSEAFLAAVLGREAIARSEAMLRERHASLSRREREVMDLVVSGLRNKQIAARLGITEITVKAHRGQVMRKMQAASLADLVRMAVRLSSTNTFV
jgi:DNA-binding CsgD family transcriptional regulator